MELRNQNMSTARKVTTLQNFEQKYVCMDGWICANHFLPVLGEAALQCTLPGRKKQQGPDQDCFDGEQACRRHTQNGHRLLQTNKELVCAYNKRFV